MSRNTSSRRRVLKTTGVTLAALTGAAGTGVACPGCGGDDDGGDGGSGGTNIYVTTKGSYVNGDDVTLVGDASFGYDTSSGDVWFEFGPKGDGLPYDTKINTITSEGEYCDGPDGPHFPCAVTSLDTWDLSGTYEYRAFAEGGDYGDTYEFTV
jgi:hypothetical protein